MTAHRPITRPFSFALLALFVLLSGILAPPTLHAAGPLRVAVAAGFQAPFREIAASFGRETGIPVEGIFSSSGSLYHQILNGAPYDAYLSADLERPSNLFKKGLADRPFTYATGILILWLPAERMCNAGTWKQVLTGKEIRRLSLANPAVGPYGVAAEAVLRLAGLWESREKKWITGHTIIQAFQYAASGGADACLCALSVVRAAEARGGCHYRIDEAPPIRHTACLLRRSNRRVEAEQFLTYLQSPAAETVKKKYGYL